MKHTLLGTAVGLIVLVLVIFFVAGREPTPSRPGQSATTAVQQQPSGGTTGAGAEGVAAGGSARGERGSGVEGVTSGGTTNAPGGPSRGGSGER